MYRLQYEVSDLSALRTHQKSIHEGVKYQCKECDYKATTLIGSLKLHQKSIHESFKYQCNECDYNSLH